jgi:hypothetical protein
MFHVDQLKAIRIRKRFDGLHETYSVLPDVLDFFFEARNGSCHRFPAHHLYWPSLDVDVAVESIRHPEKFPLISKELRLTKRTSRHAEVRRA